MGVKRAVELVLKTAGESSSPIFTWGPLIHNPQTVDFLKEQGVGVIDNPSEVQAGSTIVIRSHGVPPEKKAAILSTGANVCDATCPKVARVQGLIRKASKEGNLVVIVGNPEHAEVEGLIGFADRSVVLEAVEDIDKIECEGGVSVFGQTTLNRERYERFANLIKTRFPQAKIHDTLCDSTSARQAELPELAKGADAIIVVGGRNSSNTKRLYEVALETGRPTFWIETESELNKEDFAGYSTVAVTAGASTPHWIVSRVVERLEAMNETSLPPWRWPRLKAFGYIAIQSNFLTGLAAAMLGTSAIFLTGGKFNLPVAAAAGLFVMSMHTLYNLVDWQGLALVDPSKIRFFWGNRRLLSILSALGLLIAIPLSFIAGFEPFILMCLGSFSALVFVSLKGMPKFLKAKGVSTWRNIPGAKDIMHASGWILAAGLIPISAVKPTPALAIIGIGWVAVFAILRALLFSITDMGTDRILGRDSFAGIIGEKRAWYSVSLLMGVAISIVIVGLLAGILSPSAEIEFLFLGYMSILIFRFRRSGISRGTWAELAVDAGLLLSGALPFIGSALFQ